MALEESYGHKTKYMKVFIYMAKKVVKGNLLGMMELLMKENFGKII